MTTRTGRPTWRPPNETLDAIATVIAAHWSSAKTYPERVFWPAAGSWLRSAYHFTKGGRLIK